MLYRTATVALAFSAMAMAATPSLAFTGIGCPDLPAYARAQGTIEMGEGACNMTTAEARAILARERPDLYGPPPSAHRKHRRHSTPQ